MPLLATDNNDPECEAIPECNSCLGTSLVSNGGSLDVEGIVADALDMISLLAAVVASSKVLWTIGRDLG